MSASISRRRSDTSWRANQMSMESSNTAVTELSPARVTERSSDSLGSPLRPISTGNVTKRSISSALRPGESVSTLTCTLVTSGTASMGSFGMLSTPRAKKIAVTTSTAPRRRIEKLTICSST